MYVDEENFPGCCGAVVLYAFGENRECDCGDEECTENTSTAPTVAGIKKQVAGIKGKLVMAILNQNQETAAGNLVAAGFKKLQTWKNKNSGNTLTLFSYYQEAK